MQIGCDFFGSLSTDQQSCNSGSFPCINVELPPLGFLHMKQSTRKERDTYVTRRPVVNKKEMQMASAKLINRYPVLQTVEALQRQVQTQVNVPPPERLLSTIGGGALAFSGLRRRGWPGALWAVLGGVLLYRGITGHSFMYKALHINRAEHPFPSINISSIPEREGFKVQRTLTIRRTPQDLYTFWRDVENTPRYIPLVQSVRKI